MSTPGQKRTLLLFDVDGTLTAPRSPIDENILSFLVTEVRPLCKLGVVSGSDQAKMCEQLGGEENFTKSFDYAFTENGLVYHKDGQLVSKKDIVDEIGEEKCQKFINFALNYMSQLQLPAKRGTFVEFRSGLINLCPVGRSCSQQQRLDFHQYDLQHGVREAFKAALEREFPVSEFGLQFAIGGQISLDAFPVGWDKRYCLRHLEQEGIDRIHFFGDKTQIGGNDHEIFEDPRTIGHTVKNPEDTVQKLKELLNL